MASKPLEKALDWVLLGDNAKAFHDDFTIVLKQVSDLSEDDIAILKKVHQKGVAEAEKLLDVEVTGQRVHLTGKEYQMLELLSLRKGTTLTKEMFLNHLYGGMDEPELKIIDVFICKLRKKLANASGGQNFIETVWGRGYVLREPADEPIRESA
jgi:DNA-binding response OmpR family regulator